MPSTTITQPNGASSVLTASHVVEKFQSQWLFTPSELLKSPSILEGMPAAQEMANRQKGVNFITQVGIMLKLPQLTLATASVFLHRFYMRHPMQISKDKGIHHYSVAATALFLASKVEEDCRKMRELIVACCRVAQKQPNLVVDDQSKEYWKWRDTILHNEDVLLEALCFDLQLERPYRVLFEFLCYYGVQERKGLRNTSWAFLNDSYVTTLCLLFPPRTIAGSALYAGAKMTGVTLPDDEQGRPWWQHLDLDIFDIQKACNVMAEAYQNPSIPRQGKDAYLKEDDIMSFDRTRRTQSPSVETSPAHSQRSASQGVKREREDSWGHEPSSHPSHPTSQTQEFTGGPIPSPKRPRTGSHSNGDHTKNTRIPASATTTADDVQQRIDEIINASTTIPERQRHNDRGAAHREYAQKEPRHENGNGSKSILPNGGDTSNSPTQREQPNKHDEVAHQSVSGDNTEMADYGSEEGEV